MQRQILVPLDGSPLAETILPHAEVLARATAASLTLLQVLRPPVDLDPIERALPATNLDLAQWEAAQAAAPAYLGGRAGPMERAGLTVRTAVATGDPAQTIVDWAAQDPPHRYVAMATHGRSGVGRWVLGSVAEKVLHVLPTPLLLVRAQEDQQVRLLPARPYTTIVVPLDGSALAEQALDQARRLATAPGATLHLITVGAGPDDGDATELSGAAPLRQERVDRMAAYLGAAALRLRAGGVAVQTEVLAGQPAASILAYTQRVRAELVVLGTHGRGGLARLWLGSVALKVVQGAACPVLLVRIAR